MSSNIAFRRDGSDGSVKVITVPELVNEFMVNVKSPKSLVYDISNHQVTRSVAMQFFEGILVCECTKEAMYVDLTENRLGDMNDADFSRILKVLKQLPWLCVRFGYEIVIDHLQKAMTSEDMSDTWDTRVFVDRPWETRTTRMLVETMNRLGKTAEKLEKLEDLSTLLREMKASSDQVNTYASRTSIQFQNNIKTTATALEYEMAEAIAKFLDGGRVVISNRKWRSRPGDVDCIVEGVLDGEEVVVIGEAKMNIPQKKKDAAEILDANFAIWKDLADKIAQGEDVDELDPDVATDIHDLEIARLGSRRVVFAIGGAVFPKEEDAFFTRRFGKRRRWLRVHMDGAKATIVRGLANDDSS